MKEENKDIKSEVEMTQGESILNEENQMEEENNVIEENEESSSDKSDLLEEELKELQEKNNELNNSYLRLHAEFDNYRKRTLKEKAELIKNGGEKVLKEIIPLIDDFERALEQLHNVEAKDAFLEGLDLIYNKFANFLSQQGIKEIKAIGEAFDPEKFEAVSLIPAPTEDLKGKVIDCVQKGYSLNEKVIRFPKVIVGE